MYFDVWAADDLKGTALGTLTDAVQKVIRIGDNQPGSGSFRINRNSDQWVMCATDNLVRVRVSAGDASDYAWDDTAYKFAFLIEEGTDNVVSIDEEGGEVVELHGRSAEALLERAILDWEAHYPADTLSHPYDRTTLIDGQWHFDEAIDGAYANIGSMGGAMRILMLEAQAQTPTAIPDVDHDFDLYIDSAAVAWDDGTARYDFDVGIDLLSALMAVVDGGAWYRFSPALMLSLYQDTQGTDISGSVTFEKGLNIRESGQRDIHASPSKSRVLVKGSTKKGTLKYRWVNEDGGTGHHEDLPAGAVEDAIGVRQGFYEYPYSPTNSRLDRAGRKFINDRKFWHDGPPAIGVLDTDDQRIFDDYNVGDTVGLNIPDTEATAVIHAAILADNDAGNFDVSLEFISSSFHDSGPSSTFTPSSSPYGGSSYGTPGNLAGDTVVPVDVGEILLIWWTPMANDLLVDGSAANGNANSGFSYMVGPGNFTISSPDTGTHWHYIVVTGTAYVDGTPDT
jgi:hypothetical protein